MGYGKRLRIGLLVPSSNTTMETEFHRMAPREISVHTARMRLDEVTAEKLIKMAEDGQRAANLLATAGVDVIVFGCTTGSLVGGVEWEERLVRKIGSETGITTLSTSHAVVEAIKSIDGDRIAVATPYTADLNYLERAFLESHGIRVVAMKGLGLVNNLDIGWTDRSTVEELVRSVAGDSDIVFISCTNLPTISIVDLLERELKRPIVTSNQASLWAALCISGVGGMKVYGELFDCNSYKPIVD